MSFTSRSAARHRHAGIIAVAIVAWLCAVGYGIHKLMMFSSTPAVVTAGADRWPASLAASAPRAKPLLVMFVHPYCSCSRASIAELAGVMAAARGRLEARVYVLRIPGAEVGWEQTDLLQAAERIPGVTAITDVDGIVARQLSANVSGETSLYTSDGRRVFHGGLTDARGHQGDNDGTRAVLALLANSIGPSRTTPAFGCYLHESDSSS